MLGNKTTAYKILTGMITLIMLISIFPAGAFAAAAEEGQDQIVVFQIGQIGYQVGGQQISSDVAPYIKDDRTMVPIAFVAPALGTEPAEWMPAERQVIITKGDHEILITIDSKELIVDGQIINMDTEAEIKDIGNGGGRTMLPISFVARALEVGYEWQAETRSVYFYGYNKICDQPETIGPESGTKTIHGNVIIKTDGVILQNLIVKGNLTIAEEVGQGTVTLDNINVKGETYIRGGGSDSIYINGGQYNNIIIEKSGGKVRIVAVNAEGAPVIITDETGDNEVILVGTFDSVAVEGKNITLTTQGETIINTLTIYKQAEGTNINLSSNTIVSEVIVNTEVDFNNAGRIINAVGTDAEGSIYGQHLPENFVTAPSTSSGGGGSSTPRTATPIFTPESGQISAGTAVEISTTTAGASIYYTSDGSSPSSSSTLYEDPVIINETVTMKAIAVKDGRRNSQVAAASYTVANSDFAGGLGTETDPYQVATAQQLDKVRDNLDKHFIQTADIDLDASPWNEGEGWEPIGDDSTPFTGSYDGDDCAITGLSIDRTASYQGLFGYTGGEAQLSGIVLETININGNFSSGGLVGYNQGAISGIYVEGSITGDGNGAGGITGFNYGGTIINSCASVSLSSDGDEAVGGLAGLNSGTISGSYATGEVTGGVMVGGLIGKNWGTVSNSYSSVNATGSGSSVGGLVGENSQIGDINNCYASGAVTGNGSIGGLVGYSSVSATVSTSYYDSDSTGQSDDTGKGIPKTTAEMTTQATFSGWNFDDTWAIEASPVSYPYLKWQDDNIPYPPSDFAGGTGTEADPYQVATAAQLDKVRDYLDKYFIQTADIDLDASPWNEGEGWEPIGEGTMPGGDESSSFSGSYDGDGYEITGLIVNTTAGYQGLFGYTGSTSQFSDITLESLDISGSSDFSGGLAGYNGGNISNCLVSGSVTGYDAVGGLVGFNDGTVNSSSSSASVTGHRLVGGLVGTSGGTVSDSYASGSVTCSDSDIGGLLGYNDGTVSGCYASGSVTENNNGYAGGLVGWNEGTVNNSYASGPVAGTSKVGGFVACNVLDAEISNCYSSGLVTGDSNVGGFAGTNQTGSATIENSYYDYETSGQSDASGKGTGQTTGQMVEEGTFTGWDFEDTWDIGDSDNPSYPYLQWQDDNIPWVPVTPIDDFTLSACGPFSAYFNFSAPSGAVSVKIMFSIDDGTTWEEATAGSLSYESTSATVTGLTQQTPYLFTLVVEGGIHAGDSNIVSVTTGAA